MRLFILSTTGAFVTGAGNLYPLNSSQAPRIKLATQEPLEIQYLDATGAPMLLATGQQPYLGVKVVGEYDSAFVVVSAPLTAPGSASGFYTGTLNCNTTQFYAALGDTAGSSAVESDSVQLMGEVVYAVDDDGNLARSQTLPITGLNRVVTGSEGAPVDSSDSYTTEQVQTAMAQASAADLARQRSIWQRQGVVLAPLNGADATGIQEPTVIFETGPHILTDTGAAVFKLWYTGGLTTTGICYAESYDGLTWVRHLSGGLVQFVAPNYVHSSVVKVGSTYYLFGVLVTSGQTQMDILSSTDGITWTMAKSAALATGTGWDNDQLGNVWPIVESDGSVNLMYEALGTDRSSYTYATGLATAPSILGTYTKYGTTPVLYRAGGTVGGGEFHKINGVYYAWAHEAESGNLPTDIFAYSSTDGITWTRTQNKPVLARVSSDEGVMSLTGQVADPCTIDANGRAYRFYESIVNGSASDGTGLFRLKLAIAEATLEEIVLMTSEGTAVAEPNRIQPINFAATTTNATTLTDGTSTPLVWTAIQRGRGAISNTGTVADYGFDGAGNWTVPMSGLYSLASAAAINGLSTGTRVLMRLYNGTNEIPAGGRDGEVYVQGGSEEVFVGNSRTAFLNAGDVVTVQVLVIGSSGTLYPALQTTVFTVDRLPD